MMPASRARSRRPHCCVDSIRLMDMKSTSGPTKASKMLVTWKPNAYFQRPEMRGHAARASDAGFGIFLSPGL